MLLVVGVIVGHVTMAWTSNEAWVLEEPPVREPLLTLLKLTALVGVLFAMTAFFLIAGAFTPRSLAGKGLRRFLLDRTVRLGVPLVFFLLALAPPRRVRRLRQRRLGQGLPGVRHLHLAASRTRPHVGSRPRSGVNGTGEGSSRWGR